MVHVHERVFAPNARIPAHAHAWPSMCLVVGGALEERCGRRSEVARPLSVSLMGPDIPHEDRFGPSGATILSVFFEGDWLEEAGIPSSPLRGWRWTPMGPVARVLLQLRSAVRQRTGRGIVEQLAADALAANDGNALPTRSPPPRWLVRVREMIDDTAEWPRVGALAGVAGVHRVHLAREFRRHFGCSVSAYIRRRAVQRATDRMATSGVTLSAAAYGSGFIDHAHMCHAFQSEMGLSPTDVRSALSR